jgi:flagellar biogenesis protein FliO
MALDDVYSRRRAHMAPGRRVFAFVAFVFAAACVLGASPTTNVAPSVAHGRFDNVPLRNKPDTTSVRPAGAASNETSAIDGLDTRRIALSLAGVVTLILVLRALARWLFPRAAMLKANRATRVLSRMPLGPRQQVILLQVGRRIVVVGESGTQLTALSELTDPDEIAALVGQIEQDKAPSVGAAFGGLFSRARQPFEAPPPEAPEPAERAPDAANAVLGTEIQGLAEKVKLLSSQFRRSAS